MAFVESDQFARPRHLALVACIEKQQVLGQGNDFKRVLARTGGEQHIPFFIQNVAVEREGRIVVERPRGFSQSDAGNRLWVDDCVDATCTRLFFQFFEFASAFLVAQAVGKVMRERKNGVIVNIASDVGMISPDHRIYKDLAGGFNTPIAYATTKAGLLNFTRYLATYWAPYNIRVNSLSPAGVYDNQDPEFVRRLSDLIPLGRMAHKDEYKGAIIFLVSDASSFMTGFNLVVDGGRTCW